jgi:hypothetical protein
LQIFSDNAITQFKINKIYRLANIKVMGFDKQSSLLRYGIIYDHKKFHSRGPLVIKIMNLLSEFEVPPHPSIIIEILIPSYLASSLMDQLDKRKDNWVLWVFTETGFHRNGFSPNALRAGFHRMPFRYGVSPNFYSINIVHSVNPLPYGFSPNALKVLSETI